MQSTNDLLGELIDAHGGWSRWNRVQSIEASLSSGGFAFAMHMQPFALRNLRISVEPHASRVALRGFGGASYVGYWTPQHVRICDAEGRVVADRRNPRATFSKFVKNVHWDKLDMLYFAGYALWNYLSFPFILDAPGVSLQMEETSSGGDVQTFTARFDPDIATHSAMQTFHVDARRRLVRHDYTADVIGSWATAANCCIASTAAAGLHFYTRRKVFPRFGNRVLPFPTLVWIEIDDIEVKDGE